jgi:hypothetical protein
MKRLKDRKGEYDDTTSKKRHELFTKQFNYLTKDINVISIDAHPSIKEIVKNIIKNI